MTTGKNSCSAEVGGCAAGIYILGTALGYSLQGVTLKFIPCNPFVVNGMEKVICFLILGLSRRGFRIHFNRRTIPGAVFMYLSSVLFMTANKMTTAANAVILQYTNPVFILLISCFFLHKMIYRRDILISFVMMCGMVLFFIDDISVGNMAGNVIAIFSGIAMALTNLYAHYSKTDIREYGMINCLISMLIGSLVMPFQMPRFTWEIAGAILFYGVFCSGLPILFFAKGAPRVEPLKISMLLMLEPVCGPVWVALIVREFPGKMALAGAGVILAALAFNILSPALHDRKKRYRYGKGEL